MTPSSDEIQGEINETRARIDQDIDALQHKIKRSTDLSSYADNNLVPLVGGALLLGLLIAAIFIRNRDEDEPPLPPKKSQRRKVARMVRQAEDEGLIDENARKLLIGLLTTQGINWLRQQAEGEARKRADVAQDRVESARESASERAQATRESVEEKVHSAREEIADRFDATRDRVEDRTESARERVSSLKESVSSKVSSTFDDGGDRASEVKETLREKADDGLARLEGAVHEARKKTKKRRRFF